jgi:hypothetical protein
MAFYGFFAVSVPMVVLQLANLLHLAFISVFSAL